MKKYILLLVLLSAVLLISCTPAEKVCSVDTDCVQATCCHPSAAVPKEAGPDCAGQFCTQECMPGTIDCGQGEIKCLEGSCQVVLNE